MSGRKAALVLTVVLAATSLTLASAWAQVGPSNPSGGTSLRPTTEESQSSFSPGVSLFRTLSINPGWQVWFGTFAASRPVVSVARRPAEGSSRLAVVRRSAWNW